MGCSQPKCDINYAKLGSPSLSSNMCHYLDDGPPENSDVKGRSDQDGGVREATDARGIGKNY